MPYHIYSINNCEEVITSTNENYNNVDSTSIALLKPIKVIGGVQSSNLKVTCMKINKSCGEKNSKLSINASINIGININYCMAGKYNDTSILKQFFNF